MFLGPAYGKFVGSQEKGKRFAKKYLGFTKKYLESFREHGYDTNRSFLTVIQLDDGLWRMIDGHRRIGIMLALNCGPMVEVKEGDRRFTRQTCKKVLDKILPLSPFVVDGQRILYQPTVGFEEYNTPKRTAMFTSALETILGLIGEPAGKRILDVGCCFGFWSFELAKRGAYCVGLEVDGNRLAVCRQLSAHYGMDWTNPLWVAVAAEDFMAASRQRWDWILMPSVFHCLWRTNPSRATATLRRAVHAADQGVMLWMDHGGICASQSAVASFLKGLLRGTSIKTVGTACGRVIHTLTPNQ